MVPSLLRTTCGKSTKIIARTDHSHNELKIAAEYFKIIMAASCQNFMSLCVLRNLTMVCCSEERLLCEFLAGLPEDMRKKARNRCILSDIRYQ